MKIFALVFPGSHTYSRKESLETKKEPQGDIGGGVETSLNTVHTSGYFYQALKVYST